MKQWRTMNNKKNQQKENLEDEQQYEEAEDLWSNTFETRHRTKNGKEVQQTLILKSMLSPLTMKDKTKNDSMEKGPKQTKTDWETKWKIRRWSTNLHSGGVDFKLTTFMKSNKKIKKIEH